MSTTPAAPAERIESEEVLDLLASLVQKSLVLYEEDAQGHGRYRLLETVRQYSRDRLLETGEGEAVRGRHLAFFLALVEEAEPELWRDAAWLERLESEHDNLRAALDWCAKAVDSGQWLVDSAIGSSSGADPSLSEPPPPAARVPAHYPRSTAAETGLRLAGVLWWFWCIRGPFSEARQRLETALAGSRVPSGAGGARAAVRWKALCAAGNMAAIQGDNARAAALGEESLALCREAGDKAGIAWSLLLLMEPAHNQDDWTRAAALIEESLALFREIDDRRGTAMALRRLSIALHWQGCRERSLALAEECLALCRKEGYRWLSADVLSLLGSHAVDAGQPERGRALAEESLAIHRELGNRGEIALTLYVLACAARAMGEEGRAIALLEEGLARAREVGDKWVVSLLLLPLGEHALARGERERAREAFEEALALSRELENNVKAAEALRGLADVAQAEGGPAKAQALLDEAY